MRRAAMVPLKATAAVARGVAGGLVALALALALGVGGCAATAAAPGGTGGSAASPPVELNISAAASLKGVLTSTAPAFEKANNVTVVLNFGASGQLAKQIEGGVPTDAFISASPAVVATLVAEGLASAEDTLTVAGNTLVILVPRGNPAGIAGAGDLVRTAKLTTGDPALAPHGQKAREWLTRLGLWDELLPKFVFAGNAAQTDDYVARGEVDAGIGFASDAKSRGDIEIAAVASESQTGPIEYVGAVLGASKRRPLAVAYLEYLLAPDTQQAFIDAGFKPAPAK